MNRLTLSAAFRKLQAHTIFCVALVVALPLTGRAQSVQGSSAAKPVASLQAMAQELTHQLSSHKDLKVVVLDFAGPAKTSSPFGTYLADQFSAELAKNPGTLTVVERAKLPAALSSLNLSADAELKHDNYKALEQAVGAQCVIDASYGELKGGLGFTLYANCPDAMHVKPNPINRRIEFSPEMATSLGAPLETLRPIGGVQFPGTAGVSWPSCAHCPEAKYSHEAEVARAEGTVMLMAVITPEGRAVNIEVTRTLGFGLDQTAVAAVAKWKFKPARDPDGDPVSVKQTIEVTFHLY
jgi:TonB family protein